MGDLFSTQLKVGPAKCRYLLLSVYAKVIFSTYVSQDCVQFLITNELCLAFTPLFLFLFIGVVVYCKKNPVNATGKREGNHQRWSSRITNLNHLSPPCC